jgi:hypothetical protein
MASESSTRVPLPERKAIEELSPFLLQGRPVDFRYEHDRGS